MLEFIQSLIQSLTDGSMTALVCSYLLPSLSAVVCYVFLGIALTTLSRATGIGRVWTAWVPFANIYLLGLLADVYTDNRLTTDADRARPFYTPSLLRRRMLGYGIAGSVTGTLAAFGWLLCLAGGALAFVLLLGHFLGGIDPSDVSTMPGVLLVVGALMGFVAGAFFLVFAILYLVAFCPALYRVLTAMDAPVPALWVLLAILFPAATAIALFVLSQRRWDTLAARFSPPAEESEVLEEAAAI